MIEPNFTRIRLWAALARLGALLGMPVGGTAFWWAGMAPERTGMANEIDWKAQAGLDRVGAALTQGRAYPLTTEDGPHTVEDIRWACSHWPTAVDWRNGRPSIRGCDCAVCRW